MKLYLPAIQLFMRCGFSKIIVITLLLCFSTKSLYAVKNDSLIHVSMDKNVFLDQERFFYFKEDLNVSMHLDKRADINQFTGVLFSATDNYNQTATIIIDWERERTNTDIFLLRNKMVSKFSIEDTLLFANHLSTPICFSIDAKHDNFQLSIANHTLQFQAMGFSIKNGYKFSILPVLSENTQPNIAPIVEIQQFEIQIAKRPRSFLEATWYWFVIIIVADLLIFLWIHLRRKKKKKIAADRLVAYENNEDNENTLQKIELPRKSAVCFFGNFQVYDMSGEDITKRFSPLLKELFSVIVFSTPQKGISSDQLNELLWFDKDRTSAKNNRAVNIGKLRTLLALLGEFELSNETGYWKFESPDIFIDYQEFAKIQTEFDVPVKEDIEILMALTKQGNLLQETDYIWLDNYKSKVGDRVLELLGKYANSLNFEKSPELIIEIADRVLKFESVNEQALSLKCKALSLSGRHSSAKKVYDKFCEEYYIVYGTVFPTPFTDLIEKF